MEGKYKPAVTKPMCKEYKPYKISDHSKFFFAQEPTTDFFKINNLLSKFSKNPSDEIRCKILHIFLNYVKKIHKENKDYYLPFS